MFKNDNEVKKFEWNGKIYTDKELDSADSWMYRAKYWFYCDKPENPLTFLGFSQGSDSKGMYNMCYFKEVGGDIYYKAKMEYSNFGWNGEYDGTWVWASNVKPYPNTPINATWSISPTYDLLTDSYGEECEHVSWKECDKPSGKPNLKGQWRLGKDITVEKYKDLNILVCFYDCRSSDEDDPAGDRIYRSLSYYKGCGFKDDDLLAEEWYESTGRQWPGKTDGSYNREKYIVDGLIETENVTLVTGPLCSGKSHLIGQLCTCINNCTSFLGMDTAYGKALHIDCDTNDIKFGQLYRQIEDFYGPKTDSSYVMSIGKEVTKGLSAMDLLDGIEKCCLRNKDICLIAIDSVDSLDLDTFVKRRAFILRLGHIADTCKVAVIYSCTASSAEYDVVDMAETCDPNGLYAEKTSPIIGIIPDKKDPEVFCVHFDNKFDLHEAIKCRKNRSTHYCFDVEGKV